MLTLSSQFQYPVVGTYHEPMSPMTPLLSKLRVEGESIRKAVDIIKIKSSCIINFDDWYSSGASMWRLNFVSLLFDYRTLATVL